VLFRSYDVTKEIQLKEYYAETRRLRDSYNAELKAIGLGGSKDRRQKATENYYDDLAALESDPRYALVSKQAYYYVGNKPIEVVYEDLVDEWWRMVNLSKPDYDTYGDYKAWEKAVGEWKTTEFPIYVAMVSKLFTEPNPRVLENFVVPGVNSEASISAGMNMWAAVNSAGYNMEALVNQWAATANAQTYEEWTKSKDSILDALANGYAALYQDKWYETEGMSPHARELYRRNFQSIVPTPTPADLVSWVQINYPGQFSTNTLMEALSEPPVVRTMAEANTLEGEAQKENDDMYRLLSSLGPSYGPLYDKWEKAFIHLGGDVKDIDIHYTMDGGWATDRDEDVHQDWTDFYIKAKMAANQVGIRPSTDEELYEYDIAWNDQKEFKQQIAAILGADISSVISVYGQEDKAGRRALRQDDPRIDQYYDLKGYWAEEHQIWAKYYWTSAYNGMAGLPHVPGIE
jgi:hypothetical protein